MKAPNLLIVSYFYPPAAVGVRRVLSLVRHLPEHGWYPVVLACKAARGAGFDPNPLDDPAIARVPIVRTESLDPYRLLERMRPAGRSGEGSGAPAKSGAASRFVMEALRQTVFLPDDRAGWIRIAAARGSDLVRRHRLRAVYSSNYPQSAHVVAMRIHERTGVPWLADFRDGWTQNPAFHPRRNVVLARLQHRLERRVARTADAIVTVSPPITRHLQRLRPDGLLPCETIFNGYEPGEWPQEHCGKSKALNPGCLTLLYTGTFFGERRPDLFFAALRVVLKKQPEWRGRLRVRMRCALGERELELVEKWNLGEIIQILPPVSHRDIVAEQRRADAFLLVLEKGPGAEIMVSQKIFEYLACRRPVFAIVPSGAAAEVLARTGGATVSQYASIGETAARLGRFLGEVEGKRHPLPREEVLREFERPAQARRMAEILHGITAKE